ncbi:hypothetical protein [Stenotrophomonas sp.]|uniref:hypothetical protein n=1 Tax=Stenotrophomonas sp. TaxID=69392 RepID=UPI002D6A6139|nr:hypothetical protein [Stenotrophomonas sp.]HYQ23713.1 hypothetical protein [Stenotrophomonas sp.]
MLLSLLLTVASGATTGASDEIRQTEEGRTLVLRTIDWETGDGQRTRVTVHWQLRDDGSLLYDYAEQPPATQAVHRRACAVDGMVPSPGIGILSGEGATHGFHCSSSP